MFYHQGVRYESFFMLERGKLSCRESKIFTMIRLFLYQKNGGSKVVKEMNIGRLTVHEIVQSNRLKKYIVSIFFVTTPPRQRSS